MIDAELLAIAREVLPPGVFLGLLTVVIGRSFRERGKQPPGPALVHPDPCDGVRDDIAKLSRAMHAQHRATREHVEREVQDARNLIMSQRSRGSNPAA